MSKAQHTSLILTTRLERDSLKDIAYLKDKGFEAVSSPLLTIHALDAELPSAKDFDSIVLTSRHAARLITDKNLLALPCFAVGEATAQAASEAGFKSIIAGETNAADLTETIKKNPPTRLLWLSGEDISYDIKAGLEADNIVCERYPLYKAELVDDFTPTALKALKAGDIGVVLIHSARTGEQFKKLIERYHLRSVQRNMAVVAISEEVARLFGADWGNNVRVAKEPKREAMLAEAMEAVKETNHG